MNSLLATALALAIGFLTACTSDKPSDYAAGVAANAAESSNLKSENSDRGNQNSALPNSETININTASSEELQRIPHIGPSVAQKIIAHREKRGPFKRPEDLILVQGISDVRFRRIRHLIRVE